MRIRVIFRLGSTPPAEPLMFRSSFARQSRPWLPVFVSLAAHATLVGGLPVLSAQLADYYYDDVELASYHVEYMKLRVPAVIYDPPQEKPEEAHAARFSRRAAASAASNATARQRAKAEGETPLPNIEFPKAPQSQSQLAILQPNTTVRPTAAKLPPLAFWARRDPPAPKRPPVEITVPGRVEPPGPAPTMAVAPSPAVPNLESNAGENNVAKTTRTDAALTAIVASATAPIRDQMSQAKTGVYDATAGEGANVIVASRNPRRTDGVIEIPAGSQAPRASSSSEGNGAAGGETMESIGGSGPGRGASTLNASPSGGAAAKGSRGSTTEPKGAASAPTPATNRGGAEAFTRIMHPANGSFDVVVTQSGSKPEMPAGISGLSGSPVYSVYLRVGDEQEWVLAFCLPAERDSRRSSYQVYVEAPDPLSAPYPVNTTIPNSIIGEIRSVPVIFHGFITREGNFREMTAKDSSGTAGQLAEAFAQWKFRPATKAQLPVDVEIVLIVPPTDSRRARRRSDLPCCKSAP